MAEKEYIEREKAIKEAIAERDLHSPFSPELSGWIVGAEKVANRLASIPAADVKPVVRGKWMPHKTRSGKNWWECSVCDFVSEHKAHHYYCPKCGADMRETQEKPNHIVVTAGNCTLCGTPLEDGSLFLCKDCRGKVGQT